MTIPMIEVFLAKPSEKNWRAVAEPINSTNKFEWFEDLEGWETIHAPVIINEQMIDCDIFLCSDTRGWINWRDFSR